MTVRTYGKLPYTVAVLGAAEVMRGQRILYVWLRPQAALERLSGVPQVCERRRRPANWRRVSAPPSILRGVAAVQSLPLIGAASGLGRVFTFEKSAVTNEWGRGNAPGPRLLPDHGFQQPETHLPLPSNSMVRSLIAR